MKSFAKMLLLSLYLSCMFSVLNAQAVYNKTLGKSGTVKVDLDGDGKSEIIKYDDGFFYINSNGKTVMYDNVDGLSINDIYSKDRYIEIITWGGGSLRDDDDFRIYRYNGREVSQYASANLIYYGGISDMKQLMRNGNYCYYGAYTHSLQIRSDGKGVISLVNDYDLYGDKWRIRDLRTYYRVRKNYIRYKKDGYAMELDKASYYPSWPRIAYKYPRAGSNKRVFIVKRGEPIKIIKWKITSKYIYMQVRRVGKQGTGWIVYEEKKDGKSY